MNLSISNIFIYPSSFFVFFSKPALLLILMLNELIYGINKCSHWHKCDNLLILNLYTIIDKRCIIHTKPIFRQFILIVAKDSKSKTIQLNPITCMPITYSNDQLITAYLFTFVRHKHFYFVNY